jgi:hypothetical protein
VFVAKMHADHIFEDHLFLMICGLYRQPMPMRLLPLS